MASPQYNRSTERPYRVIACTSAMQVRLIAEPGPNQYADGYLNLAHHRQSLTTGEWFACGGGVRIRADRLESLVDLLAELQDEAIAAGLWQPLRDDR